MTILQLPEEIASKIAAGEVVERPFSVVKELIENAIDAHASEITVRVETAGMRLVEVADNGEGIAENEMRLALHRYATSKISALEDLEKIQSLGFRGEALASIAAVSRFSILSRPPHQGHGMEISLEGGREITFSSMAVPVGTRIRVEDLFFNTPARKKFLKKELTERRLIAELVSRYALFYSHIRFSLKMEGREALLTSGNGNRREILAQIFDLETAKKLLPVDYEEDGISMQGFTSPIGLSRSNRREIVFFINGRLINDVSLTSAVTRAYHDLLMVGRFPISILFVQVPPSEIDVNVHPAKAEVRFENSGKYFNIIHSQLRKTVMSQVPQTQFSPSLWNTQRTARTEIDPAWTFSGQQGARTEEYRPQPSISPDPVQPAAEFNRLPILRPIGQIGRKYIVAEGPDGLYLIDQHAAHERVLFDRLYGGDEQQIRSQLLLKPEQIQVSAAFTAEFEQILPVLLNLGFRISEFGVRVYRIDAVPAEVQHLDPKEAVLSVLEADNEDHLVDSELKRKIISRICKRAAVKAGQVLSPQEQERLIRDLESSQSPRTCPHGRPTMIHLPADLLERQFGRR